MTRREVRDQIFQLLFRMEFHDAGEMVEQLQYLEEANQAIAGKDREYIEKKCDALLALISEIDEAVNQAASGWKTTRMGKVDLCIIRLAVYEMRYEEDIPVKVAINEAVELAKKYGTDDSPSFVNGILAKLVI